MFDELNISIARLLYSFSTVLLLPVLLAIVVVAGISLLWLGGYIREAFERRHVRRGLKTALAAMHDETNDTSSVWEIVASIRYGLPQELVRWHPQPPSDLHRAELALGELETVVTSRLARLQFIARTGPMLGLLGTLIPFGPALLGLSGGDIQALSLNLVTAFASTVVGLFAGCIAFGIRLAKSSWYSRDFNELEYILERLSERESNAKS